MLVVTLARHVYYNVTKVARSAVVCHFIAVHNIMYLLYDIFVSRLLTFHFLLILHIYLFRDFYF